jgi:hypothetical protein
MGLTLPNCPYVLTSNDTYSCEIPFPNCTIAGGFDLKAFANITSIINNSCQHEPRLYQGNHFLSLTNEACQIFSSGNSWHASHAEDAWRRVIAWKFALYQLAALFPRPPLRFVVELFVLAHLMGDPISTMRDILVKFEASQERSVMWRLFLKSNKITWHSLGLTGKGKLTSHDDRLWKTLAAISDAYGEWGPNIREETERLIKTLM